MTILKERPTAEITRVPETSHIVAWTVGIVGLLAAAVGAWMYFVPATWFLGGLAEDWYLGMFTGAGLLLAGAFGFYARDVLGVESAWPPRAVMATVVSLLALAAAATFGVIWLF